MYTASEPVHPAHLKPRCGKNASCVIPNLRVGAVVILGLACLVGRGKSHPIGVLRPTVTGSTRPIPLRPLYPGKASHQDECAESLPGIAARLALPECAGRWRLCASQALSQSA
jgi:hypothetical protein